MSKYVVKHENAIIIYDGDDVLGGVSTHDNTVDITSVMFLLERLGVTVRAR